MLLTLYFETTFGTIVSWSGRIGSQKMDPWSGHLWFLVVGSVLCRPFCCPLAWTAAASAWNFET